jgi:uncharacterized protein (DUF427 family)
MRAVLKGRVLAESDDTVVVEGNHYFPATSVNFEHFSTTEHQTVCPWKGTASHYDVTVDGETLPNLAWYYAEPKEAAANIKDHVAFYGQVSVES